MIIAYFSYLPYITVYAIIEQPGLIDKSDAPWYYANAMKHSNTSKKSKLENLKLFYEELPSNGIHPVTGEPQDEPRGRISRPRSSRS